MEKESGKVLVVFGENVHFLEGRKYLEKRTGKTHPIQDYVSEAAGNKMYYDYQHAQLWAVGGDTTGIGISEAEQIERRAQEIYPEIHIDIKKFEEPMDTYYAAQTVKEALDESGRDGRVSTIFPITHRFRANQQLRQQGVKIKNKYWAESEYINHPHSTARERNERRRYIRKTIIRPKIYLDMVRETALFGIGIVDRKGKMMRKFSDRFR
jgi:hypothetical protein